MPVGATIETPGQPGVFCCSQMSREPLERLELRALEQGLRAVLRVMGVPLDQ